MSYKVSDAELSKSKALPNGAATAYTDPIQLHNGAKNIDFVAPCELKLTAPALSTTELPDTKTITYSLEHSDTIDSGYTTISVTVVQTGAGGAGAAADELRVRVPTNVKKYVRAKAVGVGTVAGSTASMILDLLF